MTDDHELAGLDPFDLLDQEAARLAAFFAGLPEGGWARPSRCAEWTVRDVLGHLAAAEEYHGACLDGTVSELFKRYAERGGTDMDSFNAVGVADRAGMPAEAVLAQWKEANATCRRRFRERGDGTVDTSVGDYSSRWQAFHVASELATHADDVGAPVSDGESEERRRWRVRASRFALAEVKPDLSIDVVGDHTGVSDGRIRVEVDDGELIEGVAARLDDASRFGPEERRMLSAMP